MIGSRKPGLQQEWAVEGRAVILTVTDTSLDTLETWAQTCRELLLEWPAHQPLLLLHDYSQVDVIISPYIRRTSEELMQIRPELPGKVAVVLTKTIVAQIAHAALNTLWKQGLKARQRRVFFDREDGLAWLLEA